MTISSTFSDLIGLFLDLILTILPVLVSLALLVFIWGIAKFIFRVPGDEKAVGEGKNLIKWGLAALFVLLSFLGIIRFFYQDIGVSRGFGVPFLPGQND